LTIIERYVELKNFFFFLFCFIKPLIFDLNTRNFNRIRASEILLEPRSDKRPGVGRARNERKALLNHRTGRAKALARRTRFRQARNARAATPTRTLNDNNNCFHPSGNICRQKRWKTMKNDPPRTHVVLSMYVVCVLFI